MRRQEARQIAEAMLSDDDGLNLNSQEKLAIRVLIALSELAFEPQSCEACDDKGWILADNSDYGWRIERCDSCGRFLSDEQAVRHVAEVAAGSTR